MDRVSMFLLVLSILVFHCASLQETKSVEVEQLGNDEPQALLNDADTEPINDPRSHENAAEVRKNVIQNEDQEVDKLLFPISDVGVQSRSTQNDTPSTYSGSATSPRDCADVMRSGETTSGVYTAYVGRLKRPVSVYCDMTTDEGGWTVFQRRKDGSVRFDRQWSDYAAGFGNVAGEFWLGNDILHLLTKTRKFQLRIDLHVWNNTAAYAEYSDFKVAAACDKYKLVSVGAYCGTAGDSLTVHAGMMFSTSDQDNDSYKEGSCATVYKGAWWYSACHASNLNGIYYRGAHTSYADGVNWVTWTQYHYSLKFVEMKIRPTEL